MPCLIKELLEKHFDSSEAIQTFLKTATPVSYPATSSQVNNQSHTPKVEEVPHDWMKQSEASPPRVTAFMPWKQENHLLDQHESSPSPPFSVADISMAICKKMAASYETSPRVVCPKAQQHPSLGVNHADPPPSLYQACDICDGQGGKEGVREAALEQAAGDVTSLSAQRILDDFMQQLRPREGTGGGKEQRGGQEWVGAAGEQTGRVAE